MKIKAFSKNSTKREKSVSIRYRINLLKFKVFLMFLKNVYFYNIIKRYKSLFFLLLLIPLNLWADENLQAHYSFIGENFKITSEGENFSPAIASNGEDLFLIVYYRKNTKDFDIYGTRVTIEGEVLDPQGIPISTAPGDQMFPSVTWNGENFFVVWQDKRSEKRWDIYGARVTSEGEVLEPDGIPIAIGKSILDQVSPTICFGGGIILVAWHGKRNSKIWNIYFRRLSKNGEILDQKPILLNPSSRDQISPYVVFNGENFFIVWQDKRNGKFWDIYGARVTREADILDKGGIQITFTGEMNRWKPILSWNGNGYYLILWVLQDGEQDGQKWYIHGKRVGERGEVLDLIDIPILGEGSNKAFPVLIWNGEEYLLIWEEEPGGNSKVYGGLILPKYRLSINEQVLISTTEETDASHPAAGAIENTVLIVWQGKGLEESWNIFGQIKRKKPLKIIQSLNPMQNNKEG